MKRNPIPFRDLLARVLPVGRLSADDQARIQRALAEDDPERLEALGMEVLKRMLDLGLLRELPEKIEGDERVRRFRDLTSGNSIALRRPVTPSRDDVRRIPLPLREWKGATTLEQVRVLFNLYDKIVTQDSQLLRGPGDILRQVLHTAGEILECDRVTLWMVSKEPEDNESYADLLEAPYDEAMVREWVLDRGYLLYLPRLTDGERSGSLAMIPVGSSEEAVHGVLHAWSSTPHHFNRDRQGLLGLLSECATDLLRRSRILENLVFVDSGTQVYNRAYFKLQLENEIARAKRDDTSLALAIADIDNFRDFNTRYGYEAGNQVLATAAQVLKGGVRPFDSVARWGGEEFAIILTAPVAQDDAEAVCERLRKGTELSRITVTGLAGESVTTNLTISIGGALYPSDGSTADSLWRAANAALLQAKQSGKNRVLFAADLPRDQPD